MVLFFFGGGGGEHRGFLKEGVKTCQTAPMSPLFSPTFFRLHIYIVNAWNSRYRSTRWFFGRVLDTKSCLCEDRILNQDLGGFNSSASVLPACSDIRSYQAMSKYDKMIQCNAWHLWRCFWLTQRSLLLCSSNPYRASSNQLNRVVSFSIFGPNSKWTTGVLLNALLFEFVYPGWAMRVYHDTKTDTESCRLLCQARTKYTFMQLCHIDHSVPSRVLNGLYEDKPITGKNQVLTPVSVLKYPLT